MKSPHLYREYLSLDSRLTPQKLYPQLYPHLITLLAFPTLPLLPPTLLKYPQCRHCHPQTLDLRIEVRVVSPFDGRVARFRMGGQASRWLHSLRVVLWLVYTARNVSIGIGS